MEPDFWHARWAAQQIGFHEGAPNRYLTQYGPEVLGTPGRLLVPLCGKTVDLIHLHQLGHHVTGVELSALAVQQFAADNGLTARTRADGTVTWHSFEELPRLQIAVADIFDASWSRELDAFETVYDRAATVALPPELRSRYAEHISNLVRPQAHMLLIALEHNTGGGPPFSVPPEEVARLYGANWEIQALHREPGEPHTTAVYRLERRTSI